MPFFLKPLKIFGHYSNKMRTRSYFDMDKRISIWIRHEKSGHKHGFRMRLGTKMHKLFNAWCERFGGGKPVTAFRFFFKGKLIDGEQTAADIEYNPRTRPGRPPTIINVTSLPEVTLPITRSNSKKIRENVRRLPHEVEATLPSWVKCTDPIPREILEEVRSTVTRWIKNVRNYVEETETYILNDEHVHQEIVDDGWAFFVDRYLCHDPWIQGGFPHNIASARFDYAEGVGRFATAGGRRARGLRARTATALRLGRGEGGSERIREAWGEGGWS